MNFPDGSTFDGALSEGKMHGAGVLTTKDGDRFEGVWDKGRLNGKGTAVWANGDRYDGEWRDGKAEGRGVQVWADGRRYEGEWRADKPHGHGIVTRADKTSYEAYFVDGQAKDATDVAAAPPAAPGQSQARPSGIEDFAGKKLSSLNGSTFALIRVEDGLRREIATQDGNVKKTNFVFLSDRIGTVYEDGSSEVAGVFQLNGSGLAASYADGRSEILALDGAGGLSLTLTTVSGERSCAAWRPEGYRYSVEERKAAVAEYARKLGLEEAGAAASSSACKAPDAKFSDAGLKANVAFVKPAEGRTKSAGDMSAAPAKTGILGTLPARDLEMRAIEVRPSEVRAVDENHSEDMH